jgi:hypothetical protein
MTPNAKRREQNLQALVSSVIGLTNVWAVDVQTAYSALLAAAALIVTQHKIDEDEAFKGFRTQLERVKALEERAKGPGLIVPGRRLQ